MATILKDLRYALRMLAKKPGFTFVALIVLALGIGANTAIFSIVNGILLRPLPIKDPAHTVVLWEHKATMAQGRKFAACHLEFDDWSREAKSFAKLGGYRLTNYSLTGHGEPEQLTGASATSNFLDILGARAELGRTFNENDLNGPPLALISHDLWERKFEGSKNIVGQAISLNNSPFTVVGILPTSFDFADTRADVWTMITPDDAYFKEYPNMHVIRVVAALKPGSTAQSAESEMDVVQRSFDTKYPFALVGEKITVDGLQDDVTSSIRPALLVLMGVVGLVLLIACANVANLLLGRAAERQKEVAIRSAIGASRWRLIRQALTESVLLSIMGGGLGVLLAGLGSEYFLKSNPFNLPRASQVAVDYRVLAFTLILAVLTGLLFGVIPALQITSLDVNSLLKEDSRGSSAGRRSNRIRSVLVVAEVALSLVLLIGAALMMESFRRLSAVPTGVGAKKLLTMHIELGKSRYAEPERRANFYDQLRDRLSQVPGVTAVAAASSAPVRGSLNDVISIEGQPDPGPANMIIVSKEAISPGYFTTMGVPVLAGREFDGKDREKSENVVIVNQKFSQVYFGGGALGKRIKQGPFQSTLPWMRIVGIVGNVKHAGLEGGDTPEMYIPYRQLDDEYVGILGRAVSIFASTVGDPDQLGQPLRSAIWSLDSNMPVSDVMSLDRLVSDTIAQPRMRTTLVAGFAALAAFLAAIGIYGVISQLVQQRRHEVGIRMALGADSGKIRSMILSDGMRLTAAGVVIGLAGAIALTRVLSSFLFGVSARNPLVFALVSLLVVAVSLLACYLPARRATRLDPATVLRDQ